MVKEWEGGVLRREVDRLRNGNERLRIYKVEIQAAAAQTAEVQQARALAGAGGQP